MKKTTKLIAVVCASLMALSSVFSVAAAAVDAESYLTEDVSSLDYLVSQVPNAVPNSDRTYYFIPGYGVITAEFYQTLYQYYMAQNYPSYYPGYGSGYIPGYGPSFPFDPWNPNPDNDPNKNPFQVVEITMNQYDRQTIGLGTSYTYMSTDPTVATVDSYGTVYALKEGTATITASIGYMTYMVYKITVAAVDMDDAGLSIKITADDPYLVAGETTTVRAYVLKDGMHMPALSNSLKLSVSDEDVIRLDGATVAGYAPGTADVIATLEDSELSASVTIYVMEPSSYPDYPFYPSYPSYPDYPWNWYPDTSYPSFPTIPWYGGSTGNWEVSTPGSSMTSTYYITKLLDVDTNRFTVQYRNINVGGTLTKAFIILPIDATIVDMSGYEVLYKNYFANGAFSRVMILAPKGVDYTTAGAPDVEVLPEEPAKPVLTPEEEEALKKQQEEEKRLEELQKNIALALEGKLEWYQVYSDIYGDSYYASAVAFVLENQYLVGKNDGQFGANDDVTYADVKEMLQKYMQVTSAEFDALNILTFKDGTKTITRQELVTVFYKAAKALKIDLKKTTSLDDFTDADELTKDNREAFAWGLANKFINKLKNEIDPNGTVEKTRLAHMLYVLNRNAK